MVLEAVLGPALVASSLVTTKLAQPLTHESDSAQSVTMLLGRAALGARLVAMLFKIKQQLKSKTHNGHDLYNKIRQKSVGRSCSTSAALLSVALTRAGAPELLVPTMKRGHSK